MSGRISSWPITSSIRARPTPPEVADLVKAELGVDPGRTRASAAARSFARIVPRAAIPATRILRRSAWTQPCLCEDYSQYVPRGHYTRSEQLQRYFRTMMWYGRINMRLQKPDETRMALLITYILRNTTVSGKPAADVWARVYDPTVFIVGKADDLGVHEYGALWDSVYGASAAPSAIADATKLNTFIAGRSPASAAAGQLDVGLHLGGQGAGHARLSLHGPALYAGCLRLRADDLAQRGHAGHRSVGCPKGST